MIHLLSASAGAGKTFQLARTYIELLLRLRGRNRHRQILAVTFTKKATAEMKERIIAELSHLSNNEESAHLVYLMEKLNMSEEQVRDEAKAALIDILQDYSAFGVSTIDSFFQMIVRNFTHELGLQGKYNVELNYDAIREEAVDNLLFGLQPTSGAMRLLETLIRERVAEGRSLKVKDELLNISRLLLDEPYIKHRAELESLLQDGHSYNNFIARLDAERKRIMDDYKRAVQMVTEEDLLSCKDGRRRHLPKFRFLPAELFYNSKCVLSEGQQKAIAEGNWGYFHKDAVIGTAVLNAVSEVGECFRRAHEYAHTIKYLRYLPFLSDVSSLIQQRNEELNRLPLAETNERILRLVEIDPESPFIYEKVGRRIQHYLIDEFQDTSTMQWQSFRPLIDESLANSSQLSTLNSQLSTLIVGDTKQSIYRWRNSDYRLMQHQVEADFRKYESGDNHPVLRSSLTENYRSRRAVVETNNRLFDLLAKQAETDCGLGHIAEVYEWGSLAQNVTKAGPAGYVKIDFYDLSSKQMREDDQVQTRIVELVQDAIARGVRPSQIALLCRTNGEVEQLTGLLESQGIATISEDGLKLWSSAEVRLIVYTMQSMLDPQNSILQLLLNSQLSTLNSQLSTFNFQLSTFNSPYDQVEAIINHYQLNQHPHAQAYLQGFLDVVYQWQTDHGADLYGFLQWWEQKKEHLTLSPSENDSTVQILTVHKSKGLQYEVVIIPYCNWSLYADARKAPTLWVEPRGLAKRLDCPFPVLPIQWSARMEEMEMADEYRAELERQYLDNLNITYVAFTRAVSELYVLAGTKTNSIGAYIAQVLNTPQYEMGEPMTFNSQLSTLNYQLSTINYQLSTINYQLSTLKHPLEHWLYDEDESVKERFEAMEKAQHRGTLVHGVLQETQFEGDEKRVIAAQVNDGVIKAGQEEKAVRWMVHECFALISKYGFDWFTGDYIVKNEQPILTTEGHTYRPDRLLIRGNKAIVIDYKTSAHEPDDKVKLTHHEQVKLYLRLLQKMGYEVEGYLCYMRLNKIEQVTI